MTSTLITGNLVLIKLQTTLARAANFDNDWLVRVQSLMENDISHLTPNHQLLGKTDSHGPGRDEGHRRQQLNFEISGGTTGGVVANVERVCVSSPTFILLTQGSQKTHQLVSWRYLFVII